MSVYRDPAPEDWPEGSQAIVRRGRPLIPGVPYPDEGKTVTVESVGAMFVHCRVEGAEEATPYWPEELRRETVERTKEEQA